MRVLPAMALLLASGLSGCLWEDPPCCVNPWQSVEFVTVDQGPDSGIEDRRTVTIRTQAEWSALWKEHTEGRELRPDGSDSPEVDFSRRMVLGVFRGSSPNACYGAEILNVEHREEEGKATVHGAWVVLTGGFCADYVTHPFHIVELDALDAEVRFEMRDTTKAAD